MKLKLVGDTVTEVATGVGGVGGVGGVVGELPPSPHAVSSTRPANVWNLNFSVFLSPWYLIAENMLGDFYFSLEGGVRYWGWCVLSWTSTSPFGGEHEGG